MSDKKIDFDTVREIDKMLAVKGWTRSELVRQTLRGEYPDAFKPKRVPVVRELDHVTVTIKQEEGYGRFVVFKGNIEDTCWAERYIRLAAAALDAAGPDGCEEVSDG